MSHAPGPWKSEQSYEDYTDRRIIAGDGFCVAITCTEGQVDSTPTEDANAHLIAAAPDLLEALRRALEDLREWDDYASSEGCPDYGTKGVIQAGDAAIAKAEVKA